MLRRRGAARGIWRRPAPAPHKPPVALDPFREVRTPERNFGPARLAGGIVVTPLARRLAAEAGHRSRPHHGSGPHGRIVARATWTMPAPSRAAQRRCAARCRHRWPAVRRPGQGALSRHAVRGSRARRHAAHHRRAAWCRRSRPSRISISPPTSTIDALLKVREQANAAAPRTRRQRAFKLSVNDFIIKAWALALQRVPAANAVWAGDRILRFKHSDIGVAVAIEGGLLTPVMRQAETKSLSRDLRGDEGLRRARAGAPLKPQEYQGGATVISNLGMYGIREFSAIINPPHATILAVGAAQRRPVEAEDGGVKFVTQMTVTLSCDHRVVDGALGAELLAALQGLRRASGDDARIEHDPEKWSPVFGRDHAPTITIQSTLMPAARITLPQRSISSGTNLPRYSGVRRPAIRSRGRDPRASCGWRDCRSSRSWPC